MTKDEVLAQLAKADRNQVAKATGIQYLSLCKLVWGAEGRKWGTKNPGADRIDQLRAYFEQPRA